MIPGLFPNPGANLITFILTHTHTPHLTPHTYTTHHTHDTHKPINTHSNQLTHTHTHKQYSSNKSAFNLQHAGEVKLR
jgi:hypothetical protein